MKRSVVVLGAGMVGVCCAQSLLRRGLEVTLIDRQLPGRETSFGNSGVLSRSSIFPINGPGIWPKLSVYATNRHPSVRWRRSLLRNPAWITRFLAEANTGSYARRSRALDELIRLSMDINRRRIAEAGLGTHLRETGWLKLWRTSSAAVAQAEARALAAFGIRADVLDAAEIEGLEPHAAKVFRAGLLIPDSASVDDPGAIVAGYAELYERSGGKIVKAEIRALYRTTTGWRTETTGGSHDADSVVVALGPWSAEILRPLGYRIPLGFERGYHVHLAIPEGSGPTRAIYDVDGGYVVSPMRGGARVTSGVELAARDAPRDDRQIEAAARLARTTFRLGNQIETEPWIGSRPTVPDSLPMIGALPREHGLYLATAHQHIGFSTGAATGELVASLITSQPSPIDPSPYDPARYLS